MCFSLICIPPRRFPLHPVSPNLTEDIDIIDEAINFFRANVFFSTFDFQGGADRTLVVLTLFISECIVKAARCKTKDEGKA